MQSSLLKNKMELQKTSQGKTHKSNMVGNDLMLESHKATKSHCLLPSFLSTTPFLLSKQKQLTFYLSKGATLSNTNDLESNIMTMQWCTEPAVHLILGARNGETEILF